MRNRLLSTIVAFTTLTIGVVLSWVMQPQLAMEISRAVEIPDFCEIHGEVLKPVWLETVCGEFSNSSGILKINCSNGAAPKLAAEEVVPAFHLAGGSRVTAFWNELAAARQSNFRHGYGVFLRECSTNNKACKSRRVCTTCRVAEWAWMKERSEEIRKRVFERRGFTNEAINDPTRYAVVFCFSLLCTGD